MVAPFASGPKSNPGYDLSPANSVMVLVRKEEGGVDAENVTQVILALVKNTTNYFASRVSMGCAFKDISV